MERYVYVNICNVRWYKRSRIVFVNFKINDVLYQFCEKEEKKTFYMITSKRRTFNTIAPLFFLSQTSIPTNKHSTTQKWLVSSAIYQYTQVLIPSSYP